MKKVLISLSLLCASFSVFGMDRTAGDRSVIVDSTGGTSSASTPQGQSFVDFILADVKLTQELIDNFERTVNPTGTIPEICKHTHIDATKATRFCQMHADYPLFQLSLNDYSSIAAISGRQHVGFINFTQKRDKYYISLLMVYNAYRRRGIASMLLLSAYATIVTQARGHGISPVTIFWHAVPQDRKNGPALEELINFYRAHGAQLEEGKPDNTMTITIPTSTPLLDSLPARISDTAEETEGASAATT